MTSTRNGKILLKLLQDPLFGEPLEPEVVERNRQGVERALAEGLELRFEYKGTGREVTPLELTWSNKLDPAVPLIRGREADPAEQPKLFRLEFMRDLRIGR